ncbi:MAG: hypothetical protein ACI9KE_006542, partial [Polyangiales bacterium]
MSVDDFIHFAETAHADEGDDLVPTADKLTGLELWR